jgi:hypothetical protein
MPKVLYLLLTNEGISEQLNAQLSRGCTILFGSALEM